MKTLELEIEKFPKYVNRSELSRLTRLTFPTIDKWVRLGILPKGHKTRLNRFWTKEEIITALLKAGMLIEEPATAGKRKLASSKK